MKVILSLLAVLAALVLQGQSFLPATYDTTIVAPTLTFHGSSFHHSIAIRNDLSGKFLFGGEITQDIKDQSNTLHKPFQTAGGEAIAEISYYQPINSEDNTTGWFLRAGTSLQFAASYPKQLFGLAMYGNAGYLDESINLSNTQGFFMHYSKLGGGLYHTKTKSSIALNAIYVHDYARIKTGNSAIRTNTSSGTTDLVMDVLIDQYDSQTKPGIGAAIDFDYYLPIKTTGLLDGFVQITARNLGFAYFDELNRFDLFGNYRYEGLILDELGDLISDNGAAFLETVKDSLNFRDFASSKWVILPGFIQIGKIVDEMSEKKWQYFFGARGYFNAMFRPMVYVGAHYRFAQKWFTGGQVSYGGYGNFRGGIYAGYQSPQFSMSIGSEDAPGMVLNSLFGRSIVARFNWKIG